MSAPRMLALQQLRLRRPFQKLRRIVTRCASTDDFVAVYGGRVDGTSILVGLERREPVGVALPVEILLNDGLTAVLKGRARVHTLYASTKRPCMRLRFVEMDSASRIMMERLRAVASNGEVNV